MSPFLVPLLGQKGLDELSPRIQRFRKRLLRFQYTIVHVPGKDFHTADALSRQPVSPPRVPDEIYELKVAEYTSSVIKSLPASECKLHQIQEHQDADEVKQFVTSGWPASHFLKGEIKQFGQLRHELCIHDNLLLRARIKDGNPSFP